MNDLKKDNMSILVWNELSHSTYWEQYLSQYCNHKQNRNILFNTLMIIFSSFGTTFSCIWKIADKDKSITIYVSIVVFALMLASQILAIWQKNVIISNETERKIRSLRVMYLDYLNEIEKLWIDIISTEIGGDEVEKKYFELRKKVQPIEDLKDSLNIKKLRDPNKKGMKEAHIRLHRKFGSIIPEEKK
jgi:hypothetical protein